MAFTLFMGMICMLVGYGIVRSVSLTKPYPICWYHWLAIPLCFGGFFVAVISAGALAWRYLP